MPVDRTTDHDDLSLEQAHAYLRLARGQVTRPVDDLIRDLDPPAARPGDPSAPAGGEDRLSLLLRGVTGGRESPVEFFVNGAASLANLREVKIRSKTMLTDLSSLEIRLSALAGYFVSIAAALYHHRRRIGGRDPESLRLVLLDLAAVAPEPYAEMLAEAAVVEEG